MLKLSLLSKKKNTNNSMNKTNITSNLLFINNIINTKHKQSVNYPVFEEGEASNVGSSC